MWTVGMVDTHEKCWYQVLIIVYHTNSYFVCDNISKTKCENTSQSHSNIKHNKSRIRLHFNYHIIQYNTLLYRFLCSFYTVYNMVVVYIRTFLMDGVGIIAAINSVTMDDFYHYLLSLFKWKLCNKYISNFVLKMSN